MLINEMFSYLKQVTSCFKPDGVDFYMYSASCIAERLHVKRNTVSHYLNLCVKEKKVIKINTRPVIFLDKATFEEHFFLINECVFKSIDELYQENSHEKKDVFSTIIGSKGSLEEAIRQIKTAAYYPNNGLPIMLCGPTGVGKSLLAKLMYQYLLDEHLLDEDAPFVVFNCAQYFNNPELISSNLFGYVKGAFTGADKTTVGMLEEADGGVLFLDEVHRLNDESQEKLFTFFDQGVFRRMGESSGWHQARVRLIFATTEKLTDNFLTTFLRRIPIVINIPGLDQRSLQEKVQFIYYFLIDEAKIFKKNIELSERALELLSEYTYESNVGELQNQIKFIAAQAFAKQRDQESIKISIFNIPDYILKDSSEHVENRVKKNENILITPQTTVPKMIDGQTCFKGRVKNTYRKMWKLYDALLKDEISLETFETCLTKEIRILFDQLIFQDKGEYSNIMIEFITSSLQEIFRYLEQTYHIRFNGNSVYTIAYFLFEKNNVFFEWNQEEKSLRDSFYQLTLDNYNHEYKLASKMISLIESKVDTKFSIEDEIFLTFYVKSLAIDILEGSIKAIIVAHGYATASSLANIANRMLDVNLFESFDMPLDVNVNDITSKLIQYIKENDVSQGLIILVDMGSLTDIYNKIKNYINGPVAIINNVSTQMCLFVGDMIKNNIQIEDIIKDLKKHNQTTYKIAYPTITKQHVIVTSCMTGMGTAIQLQKLLQDSVPQNVGLKIVVHNYARLKENGLNDAIFQLYDVMLIVGTIDPNIEGIPFVSIEQLMMGDGDVTFRRVLKKIVPEETLKVINDNIVHNFSLRRVIGTLTILDTDKILRNIEECLERLEIILKKRLPNSKKIALLVHISCLVERLIRNVPIEEYHDLEQFQKCHKDDIKAIQNAFSVIESNYSVKINMAEIGYIYDIVNSSKSEEAGF